jgi:copper transport protein
VIALRRQARWFARRACGLLGALAMAGIVLAATAPAASAHATLLFTSPAADSAVPVSPDAITLTFNEPVTLVGTPVTLTGPVGRKIALGTARESGGRSVLTVPVPSRLPDGVYTVSWQIISADGDPINSQYEFAVGPAPASLASAAASAPSTPGQWPLAVARWLLFAGLAAALGGLAGRGLAGLYRHPRRCRFPPRVRCGGRCSAWPRASSWLPCSSAGGARRPGSRTRRYRDCCPAAPG